MQNGRLEWNEFCVLALTYTQIVEPPFEVVLMKAFMNSLQTFVSNPALYFCLVVSRRDEPWIRHSTKIVHDVFSASGTLELARAGYSRGILELEFLGRVSG